jgi:mRNA-degrading endonuclease RelE of RelBE toxin-antitoxin system
MSNREGINYEIQYTKAADKFLKSHEDIRVQYEDAIKELLIGDHPEKVDVKRIKGKHNNYFRIRLRGYRVVYAVINGKIIVIATILAGSRQQRKYLLKEYIS